MANSVRTLNANFNPRSPYGERPLRIYSRGGTRIFQSTLPLRGATFGIEDVAAALYISIHAPLTGSDPGLSLFFGGCYDFNPRSPYGERR